jgi:hypothetical protein
MPPQVLLGPDAGKGKVHVSQILQAAQQLGECPAGQRKFRTIVKTVQFQSGTVVLQYEYQDRSDGGEVIYVERARFANKRGKR